MSQVSAKVPGGKPGDGPDAQPQPGTGKMERSEGREEENGAGSLVRALLVLPRTENGVVSGALEGSEEKP